MKKLLGAHLVALVLIFLLGFFLRVVNLDISPPGFNADEAALGYNAYSLIQTGKDEWGTPFPLVFKSFSDYKPGLYVYLDIPFIKVLGLNELAVRFPSILLGSIAIIFVYLLSKQLFRKEVVALSSAFLLAISPWHLHYSRGAWETNIATFFILVGIYTLIKGLQNWKWLFASAIFLDAAMYTYQSPRLVVPVLGLLLVSLYWKKLLNWKNIAPAIFAGILLIPLFISLSSSTTMARFQGVSIFSDLGPLNRLNEERGQDRTPNGIESKIYHNKFIAYGTNFLSHYLDNFSPNFLFVSGDPLKRNKVPGMGELYLFEIITVLAGIYFLLKGKYNDSKILFIWLLAAPLAAALTYQSPHALRAHSMVIPLNIISGLGLGLLAEKIWRIRKSLRYPLFSIMIISISFFVLFYFHQYYVHLSKQYALEWEYGFSQLVPYIVQNEQRYQKVMITDRYDQPYILLLFYSKYDPLKYQQQIKQVGDNKFGFTTITSFDKFEFRPISKDEITKSQKTIFVGTDEEIDQSLTPLKVFNFPNNTPVFKVVGT